MTLVDVVVLVTPEICIFLLVISNKLHHVSSSVLLQVSPFSLGALHNIYFCAEFVQ